MQSDDVGCGFVEHRGFRSDGEYIGNDWKERPNGEEYQERLRTRRPDLLERAASLRARVEAVDRQFDKKYGWGETSHTVSFSRKQLDNGRGQRAAEPAAGAREGAVSLTGVHYSREQRQSLDGRYYGTGIKGAEQERKSIHS